MIPYGRISGYLMEARDTIDCYDPGHGPVSAVLAGIRAQLDATIFLVRQAHHRQNRER